MPFQITPAPDDDLITLGMKFRVLDVREDHESLCRPIVSDYRLPFSRFNPDDIDMPIDTKILVVCEKGHRSLAAAIKLRQEGWMNIYSLQGGLGSLARLMSDSLCGENAFAAA